MTPRTLTDSNRGGRKKDRMTFLEIFYTLLALALTTGILLYRMATRSTPIEPRGKTVLITGAANGLGLGLAKRCFAAGCIVFACDLSKDELASSLSEEVRADPKRIYTLQMDVTKPEHIRNAVLSVRKALDQDLGGEELFAVVNNAGIARSKNETTMRAMPEMPDSEMEAMFDVDVFGAIRTTNAFYPVLAKNSKDYTKAGVVVNIASLAGMISGPFFNYYCACKHAVVGYSSSLASEVRPMGVRVRCIGPSFADTRIIKLPPADPNSAWREQIEEGQKMSLWLSGNPLPVDRVTQVMFDAVFSYMPYPPICTTVCSTTEYIALTLARLFNRLPI